MCKGREASQQPQITPGKWRSQEPMSSRESIIIKRRQRKKYKEMFSEIIIVSLLTLHNISQIISKIHFLKI